MGCQDNRERFRATRQVSGEVSQVRPGLKPFLFRVYRRLDSTRRVPSNLGNLGNHLSNIKNLGWLGYIGDDISYPVI